MGNDGDDDYDDVGNDGDDDDDDEGNDGDDDDKTDEGDKGDNDNDRLPRDNLQAIATNFSTPHQE